MNVRGFTPRRAMVAMCGVLMLLAVVPAVASASPEWYVNGTKAFASHAVTETGSITLKLPWPVGLDITCNSVKTGTVGPAGKSEITKWTLSGCAEHGSEQECSTASLTVYTSPWHLGLVAVGTEIHDLMGETQVSGIVAHCNGGSEDCVDLPAEILENNSNKVKGQYEEGKDEKLECADTRKGSAVLVSSGEIALTEGGVLAVK